MGFLARFLARFITALRGGQFALTLLYVAFFTSGLIAIYLGIQSFSSSLVSSFPDSDFALNALLVIVAFMPSNFELAASLLVTVELAIIVFRIKSSLFKAKVNSVR